MRFFLFESGPQTLWRRGRFEVESVVATTAMRLVPALGANPGLSSFLGQPWARGLNAVGVGVGVGKAWNRRREASALPLGDPSASA